MRLELIIAELAVEFLGLLLVHLAEANDAANGEHEAKAYAEDEGGHRPEECRPHSNTRVVVGDLSEVRHDGQLLHTVAASAAGR